MDVGIAKEREKISFFKTVGDLYILDTSKMLTRELKAEWKRSSWREKILKICM